MSSKQAEESRYMNERAVYSIRPRKHQGAQMVCPWRLLISVRDGRGQGPVSGKDASMRMGPWCC